MKTVEKIKRDKQLKQYFLWYLKSSLLMPEVFRKTMHPSPHKGAESIELVLNHQRSSLALLEELKKHVLPPDLKHVFDEVCRHYVMTLGEEKIKQLSPELLILYRHHQN